MSKILSIKGHPTRGNEIISLFEKMGGYADELIDNGTDEKYAYFILEDENNAIDAFPIDKRDEFDFDAQIFTLEEFLEKFPFKIGDFVRIPEYESEVRILKMKWCPVSKHIEYMVCPNDEEWYTAEELLNYNDNPNEIPKAIEEKKINQMSLANCDLDEVEIVLGDKFELKIENGKYYAVRKKLTYPINYLGCREILGESAYYGFSIFTTLQNLIICRNAYWKIAGEQMGLDKPWEPDWNHVNRKHYCIYNSKNNIVKNVIYSENKILAFPTEEMRDAFYENFKNEIEQCKELL